MSQHYVAVYVRISRDPEEQRIGLDRHEAEARRLAVEEWPGTP